MRTTTTTLLAALGCLALTVVACPPPEGHLDDDDVTDDDDATDDDDGADDDDATDDDDFTIPPGTPLAGVIEYTPSAGEVPTGAVRVGLWHASQELAPEEERWSDQVTEGGLLGGDTVYTVYVEGEPEASDLFDTGAGFDLGFYVPFAYVDADASGGYTAGDPLLGTSEDLFIWISFEGDLPEYLAVTGGGLGWNVVAWEDVADGDDDLDIDHTPDGTGSTTGPEISVELLPVNSGTVPLTTSVLHPTGSVVAALHTSAIGGGPIVEDAVLFTHEASNGELRGAELLLDWPLSGAPPADHLEELDGGLGVLSAFYIVFGWYDDGDEVFTGGTCDTILTFGSPRLLMYIDPSTLSPVSAFRAWQYGVPMGWSLFDQDQETWRLLAAGVELVSVADLDEGDDDDSAADDDDSAADDDDSAEGGGLDGEIPPECLPGDDDDSAPDDDDDSGADDDDSGADDDDSATPS